MNNVSKSSFFFFYIILVEDVVQWSKNLSYSIDGGLILTTSLFPTFCRYMFQRPLSPSSALLQLSDSSTGLQMSVFNGFMYFEINFFFHQVYQSWKWCFCFFGWRFFSQIVSSKGISACFNNLASFSTLCCIIQKWYATADFSIPLYFTVYCGNVRLL